MESGCRPGQRQPGVEGCLGFTFREVWADPELPGGTKSHGPHRSSSCQSFKITKGGRASALHAEQPPRPRGRSARARLCPQTHGEGGQAPEGRLAREPSLGGKVTCPHLSESSVDRAAGSLLGGGQGAPGSVWSMVGVLPDLPYYLSLAWV